MHPQAIVEDEIVLGLPIFALSCNICNLVHTKNLSTLPVAMLRVNCEGIGLNVNDFTGKRKKPLTGRITQVLKECSCARV